MRWQRLQKLFFFYYLFSFLLLLIFVKFFLIFSIKIWEMFKNNVRPLKNIDLSVNGSSKAIFLCWFLKLFLISNSGFEVACVVQTKLFFMDWFYYNLITIIKKCKISCKNLDKGLLLSRNQVFCQKMLNLWRAPTILQFNIFCWNFAHVFCLPISTKWCVGFFYFL